MTPPAPALGPYPLGRVPLVVGVVSSAATFARVREGRCPDSDAVEFRLDDPAVAAADWRAAAARLRARGIPVIATFRHPSEGGAWRGGEPERLAAYREALAHADAVDTEIAGGVIRDLARLAADRDRLLIGSFHDFARTPEPAALEEAIRRGRDAGAGVVKIATKVHDGDDIARLEALLRADHGVPLCLLGMGEAGAATRVSLALAGSVLTYGHLGDPNAPGQMPCAEIRARLLEASPAYRAWRGAPGRDVRPLG